MEGNEQPLVQVNVQVPKSVYNTEHIRTNKTKQATTKKVTNNVKRNDENCFFVSVAVVVVVYLALRSHI
jgi:stress response protein YsnF